jgi:hypothetical protein
VYFCIDNYVSCYSVGKNFDINFVTKEFPAERQFTFRCVNLNQQDSFLQPVWATWPDDKDVVHVTKPAEQLVCVCVCVCVCGGGGGCPLQNVVPADLLAPLSVPR